MFALLEREWRRWKDGSMMNIFNSLKGAIHARVYLMGLPVCM